jgi:hypothetical protein
MRIRLVSLGLLALAAAMAATAVACGGGGNDGASNTPAPAGATSAPGPTGVYEVDHVIESAITGNVIELAALAGYQHVGCQGAGNATAAQCYGGEAPGTQVEALAFSDCDRRWVRPEHVAEQYKLVLPSGQVSLYAAYRANDTSNTFEGGFGVALHVKDGRVTWVEHECKGIFELIAGSRVKSMMIAPGGTKPATPGATP